MNLTIDYSPSNQVDITKDYNHYLSIASEIIDRLKSKTCAGNDFLGWIELPSQIDQDYLTEVNNTAKHLQENSDVVVVIGIGGSYLGARAVIESQKKTFGHAGTEIVYAGHHLSPGYLSELMEYLAGKKWSIIVISKSGTTTEPAIAFRMLREQLQKQFGLENEKDRIVAITDASKGALRQLADEKGFKTFVIPDDVGGRFSVLTPVGLLPVAVAGFDIESFVKGAQLAKKEIWTNEPAQNPAIQYAAYRNAMYKNGLTNEVLVNYHHKFHYISEWWKQLYGESEGKDGKGIFPASVTFSTDLHSMGQYIQDGKRNLFETVVRFKNADDSDEVVKEDADNLDKLNYLKGKTMSEINLNAMKGTLLAHNDGGVPNLILELPELGIKSVGELLYFFEAACAISGLMLDVNPFDQPGVEAYKKNMFALLGKPGFEEEYKQLKKRL